MRYVEKKLDRMDYKLQEFDSIHDLTEYLKSAQNHPIFKGKNDSETNSESFAGTKSYGEAVELLSTGWTTMAQKLAKRVPTQTKSIAATKMKPTYGVVGGQASVPRYLQGIPTNMVDRKQVPIKSKIIVVNKDMSYSGGTDSQEIMEEGVKALQIIQALEGKGYRVKLNLTFASRVAREIIAFRVVVKKPEERFSLNKMAFPLAHTSMLRRFGFKLIETFPSQTERSRRGGYGAPATMELKNILDEKEIFLPNFIPDVDKFIEGLGR